MLYFILNPRRDAVKIGFSDAVRKRMGQLQSASPDVLLLLGICPGGTSEERAVHVRLGHIRLRGEWFRCTKELLDVMHAMCDSYSIFGRCGVCGRPQQHLHERLHDSAFVCVFCDPPGVPATLRRSRQSMEPHRRQPAGGGYRLLRKSVTLE